jgi:Tetratricopeptide Repeats-Sensor
MHLFIVRPFGVKNGIDFDRVETNLIRPAMEQAEFTGGTTGEFIQQGNIRTDMFEQLLIADLVIADVSIHNANVFYELGIRHAFRDKRTFLIKAKGDEVPFDLKTDRYLAYDAKDPAATVAQLADALKATWDSQKQDSPVYQLLPGLEPADPSKFLVVPLDFTEEVERAEAAKKCAELQLLAAEIDGFAWKAAGLRLIGNAQFRLNDWQGAKATWKAVREYDDMDLEANTLLGTIYQRLGDLVESDQALGRALRNRRLSTADRAEIRALIARNAKTQWEQDWRKIEGTDAIQRAALASPHLERSFDLYSQGFVEDRNHFYSGLNALVMVTIMHELALVQTGVWEEGFDSKEEAAAKRQKLKEWRSDLAVGVRLAIESKRAALERQDKKDVWAEISAAELALLSSTQPSRVGRAYKMALAEAPDFARSAARSQILRYQPLGVLRDNAQAALDNISGVAQQDKTREAAPHVLLFTGHRIDAEGRAKPRFPRDKENQARAMILEAVSKEKQKAKEPLLGISGGACGGDILFHEVCRELDIPTQMYLVLPKNDYIKASVAEGGPNWVERFKNLWDLKEAEILSDSDELPRWLRAKKGYSIWQRSNLWMLHNALDISKDNLTLIALWNGDAGDGPGGTEDMVERARDRGATFIHLDTRKLLA